MMVAIVPSVVFADDRSMLYPDWRFLRNVFTYEHAASDFTLLKRNNWNTIIPRTDTV